MPKAMGSLMSGNAACNTTEPSSKKAPPWTTDWRCTTTRTSSNATPKRWCASITSRPLFIMVRSEEHTSELQSHRDLHSFPTRRSSDLTMDHGLAVHDDAHVLQRYAEEVVRLNHLQTLVHHGGRVYGDLRPHPPRGVLERILRPSLDELCLLQ